MKRIALALVASLLGTGCIIDDDDHADVIVYWDFVRNAPAQEDGYVLYDDALEGPRGTCFESDVDVVDVATPVGTFTFDCVEPSSAGTGVQGTTILDVPEGLRSFTITGWRGNTAVYRHTVSLDVARGLSDVEGYRVDVEPITAPIDLFAYLYSVEADRFYTTCTEAGRPDIFYDVYDSFGTLILSEEAACTATTIADPVLVYANDLDLDNYTVRMAGYTTFVDPVFDSCTQAFDHFSAQTGEAGIAITLDTPPSCP